MKYAGAIKVIGILLIVGTVFGELHVTNLLGRVQLQHVGVYDHCGFSPEFLVDLSHGDSIVVIEHDLMEEFTTCTCWFDLEVTFENPPPGEYTAHVFKSYTAPYFGDSLFYQGSVDFSITSDQSFAGTSSQRSECYHAATGAISYPLALGNEWHYRSTWEPDDYGFGIKDEIHRIVSDTLMPNSETYWRTEILDLTGSGSTNLYFQRFDDETGIVYRYNVGSCANDEFEMFNLNYSGLGAYSWSVCNESPTMVNTYFELEGEQSYLQTDQYDLIHKIQEFVDGIGLRSTLTTEIVTYHQRLEGWIIDGVEGGTLLSVDTDISIPQQLEICRVFPNPFNPSTTLEYDVPELSKVSLIIYDIAGREVQKLVSKIQPAGSFQVSWDGINRGGQQVAGGMYFARLQAGEYSSVVKMVYLR